MKKTGRYNQANKEALISLALYGVFFAWWYGTAYGLGSGDPSSYTYVFGMPSWFFYSCIVGYIGISFLVWGVVRLFFKDISLEESPDKEGREEL
ncbi:MAG: YhdT family protein [Aminobacterium sp.]|uniref:Membrane protein YhdT n=1 Tax=bioreactor metagenome TaxID=1076179 RepID=A0A645I027_9ZZZZ|nr:MULTISPECIES: YhdT family protein [unclassified Aminobacterium]MDD2206368.1 YhdT family protein [Aminobacterium sp.]MDD3426160.1 YhdT family protein [Aminobacterium sp.]MDD3707485.1 YhdT family protein [Aminobacterium sp.]MDD4228385.1 YhdT family protein [Aminobacterium sp.]MDD4552281.1 YhdT family protein [Aminobacterium sp.]